MKRELKIKGVYRHYKGGLYLVEGVAVHTETGEQLVIYRPLNEETKFWARPVEMFLSEAEGQQKYRFELQESEES